MWMKRIVLFVVLMCVASLLTGCLYPEERLKKNQVAYPDQLQSVQTAVNAFKKSTGGMLPIKNSEENTPIYQKYVIDFNRLIPDYLADAPGNSYENGGVFQYVLIDVEKNPTVKLLDLRAVETVREVNLRVKMYRDKHEYPPYTGVLADHVFALDFEKLGYEEAPYVVSPYSEKHLPLVIDNQGTISIDYSMDLYEKLKEGKHTYKEGDDIRPLLTADSPFVPVFSLPYTIKDGEPAFLNK
jgi:hypothetical protein